MSIFTTFESVILKIKREWKYFVGGGVYLILENLGGAGGEGRRNVIIPSQR